MRRLALCFLLIMGASVARAQLLEGLLFGALGAGVNAEIAKSQREVLSSVKVVFDLYLEQRNGDLKYFCSWDPTTQTSVWFADGVVLRVIPFVNSGPPHDHTIFVNDRLVEWRKVEGGKWKGKPVGAKGVVGDYPFIYVSDLKIGFNQIKVRVADKMWGSATFIRLDIQQFMSMAQDESNRLKIAGAGGSTYPVLQNFVVRMPDGMIRSFVSLEEMQLALNSRVQMPTQGPSVRTTPAEPGGFPQGTNDHKPKVDQSSSGIKIWTGYYDRSEARRRPEELLKELATELVKGTPAPEDYTGPISIPDGMGLAVLAMAPTKFSVSLVNAEGVVLNDFSNRVVRSGKIYSILLPIAFSNGDGGNSLVFELGDFDQAPRQLTFRRGK